MKPAQLVRGVALVRGITRRRLASIGGAPLVLGAWPSRAQRAELPRECRIFIGFASGGGIDLIGRAIATRLGMRTSMRISVDNRAGRWGAIPGDRRGTVLLEELAVAVVPHGPALLDALWPADPTRRRTAGRRTGARSTTRT